MNCLRYGDRCKVGYGTKSCGGATLDRDARAGYGPETISIAGLNDKAVSCGQTPSVECRQTGDNLYRGPQ